MNIIEAWKQAKEGQRIRRKSFPQYSDYGVHKFKLFYDGCDWSDTKDILADDWEIVKEKKKIEKNYIFGTGEICRWPKEILKLHAGTEIKTTWEWEE